MAYPALTAILPHRPPMILIDEIVACDEHQVVCSVVVRAGEPFVVDGRVPALISIEYFAQTVAAFFGYLSRDRPERFTMGMLLGTRELALHSDYFQVGDALQVAGKVQWTGGELARFDCEVRRGDDILARAAINVFQTSGSPNAAATSAPSPTPERGLD